MSELNPDAIVDAHVRDERFMADWCRVCPDEEWPCPTHTMVSRLLAVRGYAEALANASAIAPCVPPHDVAADLFALLEGRPSPLEQQAARLWDDELKRQRVARMRGVAP